MNVILTTDRLVLRPLGIADLRSTHLYFSDKSILYMDALPCEDMSETLDFLERVEAEWKKQTPAFYEFAIMFEEKHIGGILAYLSDDRKSAKLGWVLGKEYRGRGFVTEAAAALRDFAIDTLGVKKIVAYCDGRNIPSMRVMEKLGMTLTDADGVRYYPKRNEKATEYTFTLDADSL